MASSDQNVGTSFDKDNPDDQKRYFNNYFNSEINYNAGEVDAVIGYFLKRGFDETSATGIATVLLQQAKVDEVNVFTLLDTLKGLTDVQVSGLVGEIVNYNRSKVSVIGFKVTDMVTKQEQRNIVV